MFHRNDKRQRRTEPPRCTLPDKLFMRRYPPSNKLHQSHDASLEVKRKDYQNTEFSAVLEVRQLRLRE